VDFRVAAGPVSRDAKALRSGAPKGKRSAPKTPRRG
jgi:hypothetical protein